MSDIEYVFAQILGVTNVGGSLLHVINRNVVYSKNKEISSESDDIYENFNYDQ